MHHVQNLHKQFYERSMNGKVNAQLKREDFTQSFIFYTFYFFFFLSNMPAYKLKEDNAVLK